MIHRWSFVPGTLLTLRFTVHANDGIETTTETYMGAGLHYSIGDAARQKLLKLGLITATKIVVRTGQGGGRAG
jgi:hypothetical protein